MKLAFVPVLILPMLAACDRLAGNLGGAGAPDQPWQEVAVPATAPQARPDGAAVPSRVAPQGARTAAALDTTTAAEKAAARAAPAEGAVLGKVVVSLGNPVEQGFWLRSALVQGPRPGVVRLASGATVQVDLLPLAGGGPQMSLAAYRALGLGLTDLPEVTVLGR